MDSSALRDTRTLTAPPSTQAATAVAHGYAVLATDAWGAVLAWNDGAHRVHGYSAHEVVGRLTVAALFGDPLSVAGGRQSIADRLPGLAAFPAVWCGQLACRHADGTWFTADAVATPHGNGESQPGVVLCYKPAPVVAEPIRSALDPDPPRPSGPDVEVLGKLGHELRSPLTGVIGLTGILLRTVAAGRADPAQQLRQLTMIRASAGHSLATIEQVLAIAGIVAGHTVCNRRLIDGREVVTSVTADLQQSAHDRGLRLHAEVPDSPMLVATDPKLLGRLLRELVDNAVKFTEAGDIRVRLTDEGVDPVVIHVCDEGPGILVEEQARIFEAFERGASATEEQDGAGLGLHLVRKLSELLHAEVAVRSRPGWGSTFSIILHDDLRVSAGDPRYLGS